MPVSPDSLSSSLVIMGAASFGVRGQNRSISQPQPAMHGNCASLSRRAKCRKSVCAILLASRLKGRWFMAKAKASSKLQALPTSPSLAHTLPSDAVLDALKMILLGAPLNEVLTTIARLIEAHSTGMRCSISLLDEDGLHLRYGVAESLPEAYRAATDGISIGPSVGSCGTAAYLRQPVFVSDIASDPRWVKYRHFAIQNGLRAAWSTPMMSHDGKVLGTFCMYYYGEVRHPGPAEIQLIDYATRIAGIAIMENTRRRRKPVSAEAIARLADEGRDVLRFFTNKGRMIDPIQRVNVHLAAGMLEERDRVAKELNISRRAVIKTLIRQALDQQYLARRSAASVKAEIAQNPCGNPPVRHSERRAHIQERIIAERLLPLRSVRENGARNRETK